MPNTNLPDSGELALLPDFLTTTDLAKLLRISRTAIYAAVKGGTFPTPIRMGPRSLRWPKTAIAAFLEREAAND